MNLFRRRFADGARLDLDGATLRLTVNRRSRRLSLRIDSKTGEVLVTAPSVKGLADAVDFARSRRDWIDAQLAARPEPVRLDSGGVIVVFGEPCRLEPDGRRPRFASSHEGVQRLTGCGAGVVDSLLVARAIKREALVVYTRRVAHYCAALDVIPPAVALADGRSRWGSCIQSGPGRTASIRLSWRLALAPFVVADYVVAHECAHLVEANHGPRFWALVHGLVGDHRPHRNWLRANGARLHAFGR